MTSKFCSSRGLLKYRFIKSCFLAAHQGSPVSCCISRYHGDTTLSSQNAETAVKDFGHDARVIDMRSDVLTKPNKAMRKAMAEANVGDDVFREDPTVHSNFSVTVLDFIFFIRSYF